MNASRWIAFGALLAALGVVLGAFGAHALEARLEEAGKLETWRTGVRYQMWHALALILFGFYRERRAGTAFPGWAFLLGSLLFSGSIYALCFGFATGVMGPLTPLGGACLILGWSVWGASALRASSGES